MSIQSAEEAIQHLYDAFTKDAYVATKSWTIIKGFKSHPMHDKKQDLFHQDLSLINPKSDFKEDILVPPYGIEPQFPRS